MIEPLAFCLRELAAGPLLIGELIDRWRGKGSRSVAGMHLRVAMESRPDLFARVNQAFHRHSAPWILRPKAKRLCPHCGEPLDIN